MDLRDIDKQITDIRIKNLRNLDRESVDDLLYELQSALLKKQDEFENLAIPIVMSSLFKERRQKLNLSMQDVTDQTDISKSTISRIERGNDAFYETVVKLDKFYRDNGA